MAGQVNWRGFSNRGTFILHDPVQEVFGVQQVLPLRLLPPGHAAVVRRPEGPAVVPVVHREAALEEVIVQTLGLEWLKVLFPPPPTT